MASEEVPNASSSSTTWTWKRVRITPAPQAESHRERSESLKSLLPWPNPRKALNVTLKYRGGNECWVEVHARGRVIRRPGYTQLVDLLQDIMQRPL